MGSIGWPEILGIMLLALIVFGPKRLPEIGRQIGKAIREVRRVSGQFQEEIRTGLALDEEPFKPYIRPPEPPSPPEPPVPQPTPPAPGPDEQPQSTDADEGSPPSAPAGPAP